MGAHIWEIVSTSVTAAASAALAWFGWVEFRTLQVSRRASGARADTEVAATAFLVRRQLRSWLGAGSGSPDALEEWLVQAKNHGTFAGHLDRAESSVRSMLDSTGAASQDTRDAAERAAAYFFNGTEWLNEFAVSGRPNTSGRELVDWVNLRDMAWDDLSQCLIILDQELASEGLLRVARKAAAQTQSRYPTMDAFFEKAASKLDYIARTGRPPSDE